MANHEEAGLMFNELSQETQLEIYKNWQDNQDEAISRLVEIANAKGKVGYDAETVKSFIEEFFAEIEKYDENDDLELSAAELSAVSAGKGRNLAGKKVDTVKTIAGEDVANALLTIQNGIRSIFGTQPDGTNKK